MYSTGPLVQTLYSITARNGAETLSGWMYALMTYKGKGTYLCDINTTNLNHPRAFYIVSNNNRHYELNWSSRAPDTVFNWLSDHIPRPQLPGMNLFMGEGPPY